MSPTPEEWASVKELFHAALEKSPAERVLFLDQSCGGDTALRAEVESLLVSDDGAAGFLATRFHDETSSPDSGDDPFEGRTIGAYRILSQIGRGGMGAVYLGARADETFQRRVAIKVVRRGMDSEEILTRFRQERRTLALLEHPNIAGLVDGGSTEDGLPYFVMEYVEGEAIDAYCRRHDLSVEDRLRLFREVCSAVHYAHQHLIVHRDLKPDNILVTADGTPKLLDFGIAKLLGPATSDGALVTRAFGRVMTVRYASPEQVKGEPIQTASDVYSLGVLLYELLTERWPYALPSLSQFEMQRAICEGEPEKPSAATGRPAAQLVPQPVPAPDPNPEMDTDRRRQRALRRRLSGDLDAIVLKAMRKEPSQRYSSAEQLSEDIRRHLAGLPVIARKGTAAYRARLFVQRHKVGAAAAALLLISLVVGVAGTSWQARVAAVERDRAQTEAAKARQVTSFLQSMLASADPANLGRNVTVAAALDEAARRVDRELAGQPDVEAAVRATIGMTYMRLGLYDAAEPHLRDALAVRRGVLGPLHPDVATSLGQLAQLLRARGDYKTAEPLLREALAIVQSEEGGLAPFLETAEAADLKSELGGVLQEQGRYAEAETAHRETLAIRRHLFGNMHPSVAASLNNLAVVLGMRGDAAGAVALHRESLAVVRAAYGGDHPDIASALSTLASALEGVKDYSGAVAMFREALEMRRRLLGPDHPEVAWTLYNYAYTVFAKRDYEEAARLSREALALRGKTLPDGHPLVPATLQVLARSLMAQGQARPAEPLLRESLALRQKTLPADHWLIDSSKGVLGECLADLRRFAEAEVLLLPSLAALESKLGPQHERTQDARARVARMYETSGRPRRAAAYRNRTP